MAAVFNALLYLTAFLVGAGLLAACTEPLISAQILDFLRTPNGNMVMAGVALVFLLCPLAVLLRWWQVFRRARDISYTTENGKISVSLIAIEEALTRAIEGESEVKKATVRVFEDRVKRSIVIEAIVTLWEVANVTERNRFCQRLLRRRFAELMPEQTVVQVNLTIHRLNQRRLDQRPAHKTTAPITAPAGAQAAQAEIADELTPPHRWPRTARCTRRPATSRPATRTSMSAPPTRWCATMMRTRVRRRSRAAPRRRRRRWSRPRASGDGSARPAGGWVRRDQGADPSLHTSVFA